MVIVHVFAIVYHWCPNVLLQSVGTFSMVRSYVNGDFSINDIAFYNLPKDKQEEILNYKLMIYFCEGIFGNF